MPQLFLDADEILQLAAVIMQGRDDEPVAVLLAIGAVVYNVDRARLFILNAAAKLVDIRLVRILALQEPERVNASFT